MCTSPMSEIVKAMIIATYLVMGMSNSTGYFWLTRGVIKCEFITREVSGYLPSIQANRCRNFPYWAWEAFCLIDLETDRPF